MSLLRNGFVFAFICLIIVACRNTQDTIESMKGNASIKVVINGSNFDDSGLLGTQANTDKQNILGNGQHEEILLKQNSDYKLVATLISNNNLESSSQASSKNNMLAVTETNPLDVGIMYKVIVFDNTGKYIKEQNYISGQNGTEITGLDGGINYTFIAYSVGLSGSVPDTTYSDPLNKTLSGATVESVSGNNDLMYYNTSMIVTGNNTNYLNITFRHKFSQITTTLDTNATNVYKIVKADNVSIVPHNSNATLKLSDGSIAGNGVLAQQIVFPVGDGTATSLTAAPVFINATATTTGTFTIGTITLKLDMPPTATNIVHNNIVFNNLKIIPGVKYDLKLSFVPNDKYLIYNGIPAVRMNGIIWMRHNLGVNTTLDPDTPGQNIMGNYYQFGKSTIVADAYTSSNAISGWNTTLAANNAWNSGTELNPIKNAANDPCPSGYRVPTRGELRVLGDQSNVSYSFFNHTASDTNYNGAMILTSKYNSAIRVTIPLSGARAYADGSLSSFIDKQRGYAGLLWSSAAPTGSQPIYANFGNANIYVNSTGATAADKSSGFNIRCVAELPYN
ncbi:FISUMP domain-containing protein [Elizabethkingia anophelis]|uniref:FISUMP domain-containing protein n=1 Tax=Elizabethkingia anophelis TaxID=1117645 RepID=UPI0038929313